MIANIRRTYRKLRRLDAQTVYDYIGVISYAIVVGLGFVFLIWRVIG